MSSGKLEIFILFYVEHKTLIHFHHNTSTFLQNFLQIRDN